MSAKMHAIQETSQILEKAEIYTIKQLMEHLPDKMIFHDVNYVRRVIDGVKEIAESEQLTAKETELALVSAWMSQVGLKALNGTKVYNDPIQMFQDCVECNLNEAKIFFEKHPYDNQEDVYAILLDSSPIGPKDRKISKVLSDGITIDWGKAKSHKRIKKLYQEFILMDLVDYSKKGFYEVAIDYLQNHEYLTTFGKETLEPKKASLVEKLRDEHKALEKEEKLAVKRELGISDNEMKKLRKSLESVKGRDERGIQTMFRTTSRNHYTLNQMVDRKANIMISVNAIILSLLVSRIFVQIDTFCIHNSPILLLLVTSLISIIFSILAITPVKSHGEFTEKAVRSKNGNLLYFGNYHNMYFKDYHWGMLQMLNDSDYLYTSMIRDQYFLGQTIQKKHTKIRLSLLVFMVGLVATIVLFMIVSSLPDFHFGNGNH